MDQAITHVDRVEEKMVSIAGRTTEPGKLLVAGVASTRANVRPTPLSL